MVVPKDSYQLVLVFLMALTTLESSEVPRPRGVAVSRAALYLPNEHEQFSCFDGSNTIPFSQINDDYCDCPDGSDEPGTSACPNGSFYCRNAGHRPENIASSRVNDAICDCCDGSDEFAGRRSCPNVCSELGQSARAEAARRALLIKAGKQVKADMISKGAQLKQDKQAKLNELSANKAEAQRLVEEKKKLKEEAERLEEHALEYYRQLEEEAKKQAAEAEALREQTQAEEYFQKWDSNSDGLLHLEELRTRTLFDRNNDGEISDEELSYFLDNKLDGVDFETFYTSCWANIKPALLGEAGLYDPPEDADQSEVGSADPEHEEEEEEEDSAPTQPPPIEYDPETRQLVEDATEARAQHAQAEQSLRDLESELSAISGYLTKDFGPEEEFAVLEGQCFEHEDHEYVYRMCPFDRILQIPRTSGSETRLGEWGRWSGGEKPEIPEKYDEMLYDRGQSCWNGPQRATRVRVHCGSDNRITSVTEPNRCEYQLDFETPAACRDVTPNSTEGEVDLHDEL